MADIILNFLPFHTIIICVTNFESFKSKLFEYQLMRIFDNLHFQYLII